MERTFDDIRSHEDVVALRKVLYRVLPVQEYGLAHSWWKQKNIAGLTWLEWKEIANKGISFVRPAPRDCEVLLLWDRRVDGMISRYYWWCGQDPQHWHQRHLENPLGERPGSTLWRCRNSGSVLARWDQHYVIEPRRGDHPPLHFTTACGASILCRKILDYLHPLPPTG